ncbi:hypothetical protein MXD62_07540 [Frankia sp. Mgl5]|uniref:hypothetical protein n=1 Tax=Frankia sp. Mgl5 TaxID=2933793 RepID=UPI00200D95B8|nr:hypothetical protein [Frankia sp. Mgl5]MCK9927019.1 hypothetical protein [Frankia sp. Mgl5]
MNGTAERLADLARFGLVHVPCVMEIASQPIPDPDRLLDDVEELGGRRPDRDNLQFRQHRSARFDQMVQIPSRIAVRDRAGLPHKPANPHQFRGIRRVEPAGLSQQPGREQPVLESPSRDELNQLGPGKSRRGLLKEAFRQGQLEDRYHLPKATWRRA